MASSTKQLLRLSLVLVLSVGWMLVATDNAYACVCAPAPQPESVLERYAMVFTGKVVSRTPPEISRDDEQVAWEVEVETVWKGSRSQKRKLRGRLFPGTSCSGEPVSVGRQYLFMLNSSTVAYCSAIYDLHYDGYLAWGRGLTVEDYLDELSESGPVPGSSPAPTPPATSSPAADPAETATSTPVPMPTVTPEVSATTTASPTMTATPTPMLEAPTTSTPSPEMTPTLLPTPIQTVPRNTASPSPVATRPTSPASTPEVVPMVAGVPTSAPSPLSRPVLPPDTTRTMPPSPQTTPTPETTYETVLPAQEEPPGCGTSVMQGSKAADLWWLGVMAGLVWLGTRRRPT